MKKIKKIKKTKKISNLSDAETKCQKIEKIISEWQWGENNKLTIRRIKKVMHDT